MVYGLLCWMAGVLVGWFIADQLYRARVAIVYQALDDLDLEVADTRNRCLFKDDTIAILNKQVTIAEERVRDVQDRSRVIDDKALAAQIAMGDLDEALTEIRDHVAGIMKFGLKYEEEDNVPF
jgi:hypothetical protein